MVQGSRIDPLAELVIDRLFASLVARAPRRPSQPVEIVPNYPRVTLLFGSLRKRWKRREPIPKDTAGFAQVLKDNGVHIFAVERGFIECQAAQNRIQRALGS
jgi:hypothetical protein